MKELELPVFGIRISLTGDGGGAITSDLKEDGTGGEPCEEYDAAIDGIESMILAYAVEGGVVDSPAFLEAI